ncbi:hypothetical protein OIY81_2940 [Cryptosporidium canis]|uniref:Uncharacterized protein n=1 Tax=Cryptosporidium canis TaxID=195482 RepID=A0ABQ8P7R5_9CRYT|nr:hypothetical protein OIY81_2940 [Cryptosporidium canis]KAJ1610842.1 hypothetical protein OJ252_1744 [Cryptosporidium canis]
MNKRKERSEEAEVSYNEQFTGGGFDVYGFGDKRRNLNDYYNGKQLLGLIGNICEKENSCHSSSSAIAVGGDDVGMGAGVQLVAETGAEVEADTGVSSVAGVAGGGLEVTEDQHSYQHLAQKYQNLQNSHVTLQRVVKSLLDKLSQLNELCSQKDRELSEYKVQVKKLVEANETLNMYIQSSHSSLMSNSMINKFGSDIY